MVEVEREGGAGDELAELRLAFHKGEVAEVDTIHIEHIKRVGTSVGLVAVRPRNSQPNSEGRRLIR